MRFWKWLPQKTEIFRQTFQPSNLITNSNIFLQDSRHYERSKNFAGFRQTLFPKKQHYEPSKKFCRILAYQTLYVKPLYIKPYIKPEYNCYMPKRYFARFGNSISYNRDKGHPSLYRRILAVLRRQHKS